MVAGAGTPAPDENAHLGARLRAKVEPNVLQLCFVNRIRNLALDNSQYACGEQVFVRQVIPHAVRVLHGFTDDVFHGLHGKPRGIREPPYLVRGDAIKTLRATKRQGQRIS